ncbi:hypothetical protein [Vibrio sp. TRT 17S01]|uniref:hypothetical protein n=1 Tax=Vibrio sp. TRT 17S01 TaxID=3418505 RepID=UPI003CEF0CB7
MLHQVYAYIESSQWQAYASERYPDALHVGNYKLVVFTNEEEPSFVELAKKHGLEVKRLTVNKTIEAMLANKAGAYICTKLKAKSVKKHFDQLLGEDV